MSSKPADHHPCETHQYDPPVGNPSKALAGILVALSVLGLLLFGSVFGIVYGVHRIRMAARQKALDTEARLFHSIELAPNEIKALPAPAKRRDEAQQAVRMETPVANLDEALALAEHGDETDYRRVILWMAGADQTELGSLEQRDRLASLVETRSDVSEANAALGAAMAQAWRGRGTPATPAPPNTDAVESKPAPPAPQVATKSEKTALPTPTGPLPKSVAEWARQFGASMREPSDPPAPDPFPSVAIEPNPNNDVRVPRSTDEILRRARERHSMGTVPLTTRSSSNADRIIAEMRERQRRQDEERERRLEEYRAQDREMRERASQRRPYLPPLPYPR